MGLNVLFDRLSPDSVEQEVTQKEQFDTDEVTLAETLVRESHQNSIDARPLGSTEPVRTRIALKEPDPRHSAFWRSLLEPLRPHLSACGFAAPADMGVPRVLVIEDFGTSGLTGQPDQKDESNFQDFWRRVGRSHKHGDKGGSWGLGKIVFPAASEIRSFFGLTVRNNDPNRQLLMGEALLKHHSIGGSPYHPIGYFAVRNRTGFRVPSEDPAFIDEFRVAAAVTRTTEPGLSIAIPFVRDDIALGDMVPYVVRNYFFPILTGQLVVEIAERTIDAASFESLAARYGGAGLADGHLIRFIREVNGRRSLQPSVVLDSSWTENMERSISPEVLQSQRESFARGDLIYVRAPLSLTRKSGQAASGAIDLFVRRAADETSGRALFIRGSLTVPNESTCFPSRRAFAALVAYGIAAEFLRDAENPAHTKWNGQAERLKENWRNPGQRLNRIRHSLRQLHDLLAQAVEWKDENALIRVLSVRDPAGIGWPGKDDEGQGTRPPPPRPPPPIRSRPKLFSVKRIASGFVVAPEAGLTEGDLPLVLEVRAGYDLARGDPFKKHSPFDFDLTRGDGGIIIEAEGATVTPVSANALRIDAATTEFEVRVAGFDTRRDLRIRAVRESR